MQAQNITNHIRKVPKAFYLAVLLALFVMVVALLFSCSYTTALRGLLVPVLFSCLAVGIMLVAYFARAFALKAQDRAIRAEENLRCFVISGKLLNSKLSISQIIALRFASDEEFIDLSQKAVSENLSNQQIKESIKNWRADHYRV